MRKIILGLLVVCALAIPQRANAGLDSLNTHVGGAIQWMAYGPYRDMGDRVAVYGWAGAEFWRPTPDVHWIAVYQHLDITGIGKTGDGAKLIVSIGARDLPGFHFQIGGGFLTNMAGEAVEVPGGPIEPLALIDMRGRSELYGLEQYTPRPASTPLFEIESKTAFNFDFGISYQAGDILDIGVMVHGIDHGDVLLPTGAVSGKSTSLALSFWAGLRNLEDLMPF